jgi:hexosaminidase
LTQRFMEWRLIAPALEREMAQNPRMSDAALRAQQLGKLGSLGLQALAQRDPGNHALGGLLPKGEVVSPDQQAALIDNAQEPAALVRFTFLDSLRKLLGSAMPTPTGPVGGAATPPAQP